MVREIKFDYLSTGRSYAFTVNVPSLKLMPFICQTALSYLNRNAHDNAAIEPCAIFLMLDMLQPRLVDRASWPISPAHVGSTC